jgi:hypothetical protein
VRALYAAVAVALAAMPAPAAAQPAPAPEAAAAAPVPEPDRMVVGILDVRTEGLPAAAGDEFERQLEALSATAARGAFWIASRDRLKAILANSTQWIDGCLYGPCMRVLREQTRAAVVVTVVLQSLGTTYRYVITLVRTDTGAVIDQRTEACGACTQDEAIAAATTATVDALVRAPETVAEVALTDPDVVARRTEVPLRRRLGRNRTKVTAAAAVLTGLAVVGGVLGGYWLSEDDTDKAGPALGAAAGLATAGMVGFAVAWSWD